MRHSKYPKLAAIIALCLFATGVCLAWVPHAVAAEPKDSIGSLEFDFLTTCGHPMNSTDRLRGNIPLYAINPTIGTCWCKGEFMDKFFYDVVGEGKLHGISKMHLWAPPSSHSKIQSVVDGQKITNNVKIKGKLWWKPNELQCSDETISIGFTFTKRVKEASIVRHILPPDGVVVTQPLKGKVKGAPQGELRWWVGSTTISETVEFQMFDGMTYQEIQNYDHPMGCECQRTHRLILHLPPRGHPDLTKPLLRYESPPPDPTKVRKARLGPSLDEVPYGIPPKK